MSHTPKEIARKLEKFAKFLREEYLNPKHFDGWPGLPPPKEQPGVPERVRKMKLADANLYVLGCIIDMREYTWKAWRNAHTFCDKRVPQHYRHRMWNWIADEHSIEKWRSKKKDYSLHWIMTRHEAIHRIAGTIARNYQGDPRLIWQQAQGIEVLDIFENELRIGPEISRMTVGGLRDHKLVTMDKGDFKADRHVCKMMHILGLSKTDKPKEVKEAANTLFDDPWSVDGALWELGKDYEIETLEGFLNLHQAMKKWLSIKAQVSKLVRALIPDLKPILGNGWDLIYDPTHHFSGLNLKRKDGPLAHAMEKEDFWAWVGVGFSNGLAVAIDVGGDPQYFDDSVVRLCRKLGIKELRHTSSGAWGMREFYSDRQVNAESLLGRDRLLELLTSRLAEAKRFVEAVEYRSNSDKAIKRG